MEEIEKFDLDAYENHIRDKIKKIIQDTFDSEIEMLNRLLIKQDEQPIQGIYPLDKKYLKP